MMFCPDCAIGLDEVAVEEPCPRCGSGRRSAIVFPQVAFAVGIAGEVSLKLTKGDHRPWQEKWALVLHCLDALSEVYSPGGDGRRFGSVEVDRRAVSFFVECDHMRDWLEHDPAVPVTKADIDAYWLTDRPLTVCNAVSNSDKHHTRRSGVTARIREVEMTPEGARLTIEVDWALPTSRTVDALQLARDCVASWRSFFDSYEIQEQE